MNVIHRFCQVRLSTTAQVPDTDFPYVNTARRLILLLKMMAILITDSV